MKVVAFNGSSRKDGNTAILLNAALDEIEKQGIRTELIQLAGKPVQGCTACFACFKSQDCTCVLETDELNDYLAKMVEADGIILGSPTYFSDVTASMKGLIERCGMVARANGDLLKRKAGAGIVAVRRAGAMHAFNSLNLFFTISQMIIPGSSYWNIGIGLDPGDVDKDEEGIQTVKTLGQNMAWLLKKLK